MEQGQTVPEAASQNGATPIEDNQLYQKRIRERLENDTGRQRTRIYFVRHGETDSNLGGLFCGQSETQLTGLGRRQAQQLGLKLAPIPFSAAYASDLSRCLDTAALILEGRGLAIAPEPRLREMAYGEWELMSGADLRKKHPDVFKRLWEPDYEFRAPGGESVTEVRARMRSFLHDVVKEHAGEEVLAVSHGGAIQCLISDILGMPVSHVWRLVIENTGVSVLDCYGERVLLSRLNDRGHLDGEGLVSRFGARGAAAR